MRVLLDTNIILDVLLQREPFVNAATAIWQAHEQGRFEGYISAITPLNIFYIARKIKGQDTARVVVSELLMIFRICPLDVATLQTALGLPLRDYEDSAQVASALTNQIDVIVTRDTSDYNGAPLPVFSPLDFLAQLA